MPSRKINRQDLRDADKLAQELATTKHDLDVLLKLLNRACDGSARAGQAMDRELAELRKSLGEARDRNERLERDLAGVLTGPMSARWAAPHRLPLLPIRGPAVFAVGPDQPKKLVLDRILPARITRS